MPIYEYRHTQGQGPSCTECFEIEQRMRDDRLAACPVCGQPVERLVSMPLISTPKTNTDLKNLGFTKLVKRDDGVYENVTRGDKESRYMKRGDASTIPDVKSKISD